MASFLGWGKVGLGGGSVGAKSLIDVQMRAEEGNRKVLQQWCHC
jgi:hypothetical protein